MGSIDSLKSFFITLSPFIVVHKYTIAQLLLYLRLVCTDPYYPRDPAPEFP